MSAIPSSIDTPPFLESGRPTMRETLARISSRAEELDRAPRFPRENFEDLACAGVLQAPAVRADASLLEEIALVRAVAGVDASTARILDGHLNGVERVALRAPGELRERELAAVAAGELLLGVWGADPAPGEGEPARLLRDRSGSLVVRGVKTFCSGAGGVQRALVVVCDAEGSEPNGSTPAPAGTRRLAYLDTSRGVRIDHDWYRASGLRASESHRVQFTDAPVLALLGGANELTRQPYFARDAVRTAATWAGIVDGVLAAAASSFEERDPDEHQAAAFGRMQVAHGTIDRWLEFAGMELDAALRVEGNDPAGLASETRAAITDASRAIADEAARACGSRALAAGGALDRGRRDLDLFLLQHRLEPQLARLGRASLRAEAGAEAEGR